MVPQSRTLAALLALGAPAAAAPMGCFVEGWVKPTGFNISTVANATDCQDLCVYNATCEVFGYYPDSMQCWLGENASEEYVESPVPAVSGPKVCTEETNACNLAYVAPAGWPASTIGSSMALWHSGFQPQKLQCYPADCWMNTGMIHVLEDVATGWTDLCQGMTNFTDLLGPGETCESSCQNNQSCPAYQVGYNGTCWQGVGFNCSVPPAWDPTFAPVEGKRFQRGAVRVMRELTDVQIMDLMQVFGPEEMTVKGTEAAKRECRDICYSILECEYWQLSNVSGCYVEPAHDPVAYPLHRGYAGLHETTALAEEMIAGEYIQRYCSDEPAPTPEEGGGVVEPEVESTTAAPASIPMLGIFGIIMALLCLIACCVGAAFIMGMCGKKTEKKRSVKSKKRAVQPLVANAAPAPAGGTSLFDKIDVNHDGVITKEEFMRSVQVVPMGGVAPVQQPLPTVSMPMPTYQLAAPAPVASQPVTYAAPPASVAAPVTYTTTAASSSMAPPPMMPAAPAPMVSQPMMAAAPMAAAPVPMPVATGVVPTGMVQQVQPQYGYATQMAPSEPILAPGM